VKGTVGFRRLLVGGLLVAAALAVQAGATPAAGGVDQRTRAIADLVRQCGRSVTVALHAADGASRANAIGAVKRGKASCGDGEQRLRAILGEDGLDLVVENALVPIDQWDRALGRISRYIQGDKPADRAKGKQLLVSGYAWSALVLREINDLRQRSRLARI
jgi:hypothetical protein